ncbi:hypothetical protein OFO93_27405, partial [Escherichia coli]|nr:hypothetical protein [Escherichia coli]
YSLEPEVFELVSLSPFAHHLTVSLALQRGSFLGAVTKSKRFLFFSLQKLRGLYHTRSATR